MEPLSRDATHQETDLQELDSGSEDPRLLHVVSIQRGTYVRSYGGKAADSDLQVRPECEIFEYGIRYCMNPELKPCGIQGDTGSGILCPSASPLRTKLSGLVCLWCALVATLEGTSWKFHHSGVYLM